MTPDAARDYLLSLPRYAGIADPNYKPGLERMAALMDAMDAPHETPSLRRSVHVAGTNGKGSVASMIAAIATADGQRVGLHTSPHFVRIAERMRIDGQAASDDWLADAVGRYRDAFEAVEPSFFEATVALSFRYFADEAVDRSIIEVGLGGRLDGTNVLRPAAAVVTDIDLDHTDILGDTLSEIAREKAGIFKPDTPALTAVHQPEALATIRAVADAQGAPLEVITDEVTVHAADFDVTGTTLDVTTPVRRYDGLRVDLPGAHQQRNALLALRVAETVLDASADAIHAGLRDVRRRAGFRGRCDVLQTEPLVIADAAHNPSSLAAALELIRPALARRGGRLHVGFGGIRDKDLAGMGRLLRQAEAVVYPVRFDSPRSMPPDETGAVLKGEDVDLRASGTVPEIMDRFRDASRPEDGLLLAGSHAVVAEVPALRPLFDGGPA